MAATDAIMLQAAISVAFFGLLRPSEYCYPHLLNTIHTIAAIRRFLSLRVLAAGQLFTLQDGSLLTRTFMSNLFATCFPGSSLDTHSFRIGGASVLSSGGLPVATVQMLGRWTSNCLQRYIHFSDAAVCDAMLRMAHSRVSKNTLKLSDQVDWFSDFDCRLRLRPVIMVKLYLNLYMIITRVSQRTSKSSVVKLHMQILVLFDLKMVLLGEFSQFLLKNRVKVHRVGVL